ncbi:MAG: pilin [Parcubacteria group bacterium]
MANKKLLFLALIFGTVLFWANSYPSSADCASCTQECNNLNANAPEVPTDCDAYCSSQCNSSTGGCCVVDSGNCLDTSGTSCSYGTFFPKACSQLPTCAVDNPVGEKPPTNPVGDPPLNAKLSGKGIEIPTDTGLPDPPGGIAKIIRNLLTWLLGIVGVIAIIGFVISGIQYLTSAGDEDRMQSAKRNMLYAIIGVVVVLSSFVVIQAIQYALEAKSMF